MKKKLPLELEALLNYFPLIDPPITLSEEVTHKFSAKNKPLSEKLIAEVFSRWDKLDEYTELVPCLQLPVDGPFYAIIYWKGALMSYEFILATLDEQGILINKKVIAGTISNGMSVKTSVATIDEDGCIYSMVGENQQDDSSYDPTASHGYKFEILPDGNISADAESHPT